MLLHLYISQLRSEANFCHLFLEVFCQSCTLGFVPLFSKSVGHTVRNIYLFKKRSRFSELHPVLFGMHSRESKISLFSMLHLHKYQCHRWYNIFLMTIIILNSISLFNSRMMMPFRVRGQNCLYRNYYHVIRSFKISQ